MKYYNYLSSINNVRKSINNNVNENCEDRVMNKVHGQNNVGPFFIRNNIKYSMMCIFR